ncbi:hypothetical protein GCM10009733_053590 [Nonomuraea maheshkhaliensis]|uniref:DUF397 domain-containing protein n=1 Tax=Nonomuraea maheshkhaliensis TaxID=419590 RepID=A0ABN2FJE7_9ACTN
MTATAAKMDLPRNITHLPVLRHGGGATEQIRGGQVPSRRGPLSVPDKRRPMPLLLAGFAAFTRKQTESFRPASGAGARGTTARTPGSPTWRVIYVVASSRA